MSIVMERLRTTVLVLIGLSMTGSVGCSLCCSPYTDDYVTYGSRTPRIDRKHGRVGSTFSDHQMAGNEIVLQDTSEVQQLSYEEEAETESPSRSMTLGAKR